MIAPDVIAPVVSHSRRASRIRLNLLIGVGLLALVAAVAVLSALWTPQDATHVDIAKRLLPLGSPGYWLGADQFGRDEISQLMLGSRTTLLVGVVAVGIALFIGTPMGAIAALRGGLVEEAVMRAADLVFAFPALLLAIMLSAVFGPSTVTAMVAVGIAAIPVFARLVRGAALQVLEQDYIRAARACGSRTGYIVARHVLPNIAPVLIVQATVAFALAVLAEAALSYLGLGTQPPTPSWGRMLNEAQNFLATAPLLALWPGLAIALTVLGLNLLGDGLRDALDPRLRDREP